MLGSAPENNNRDAVHVAILPMYAGTDLKPGQGVGSDGYASDTPIGVADPFLKEIKEGDQFYCLMNPDSITNLSHTWSHPNVVNDDYDDDGGYDECRGCY